jgi:hypothetical protein
MRIPSCVRALAVCTLTLAVQGCAAERQLIIQSDPPGATVRLDDRIVGTTPYEEDFLSYGTRRVTLYRTGYRTHSERIKLRPPWYGRFPFDIISEVLIPLGWKDVHRYEYELEFATTEVTVPDLDAVLERARALRMAEPEGPRPKTASPPAQDPPK